MGRLPHGAGAEGGLVATMQYNTDLFEGERVERMLEHLERVLVGMVRAVASIAGLLSSSFAISSDRI